MGTGIAFAIYGELLARAGTVRGMIGIFFTPIVGTILGVAVRGDSLHALAIVGMSIVIVGAVMVSRPEPRPVPATSSKSTSGALPERLLEVGDQVGSGLDSD
jgi:drug/metabolite transporter (DMT)-like permease